MILSKHKADAERRSIKQSFLQSNRGDFAVCSAGSLKMIKKQLHKLMTMLLENTRESETTTRRAT